MPDHNYFANLIWQIADVLRGPYRSPQYERTMPPITVPHRFDYRAAQGQTGQSRDIDRSQSIPMNQR